MEICAHVVSTWVLSAFHLYIEIGMENIEWIYLQVLYYVAAMVGCSMTWYKIRMLRIIKEGEFFIQFEYIWCILRFSILRISWAKIMVKWMEINNHHNRVQVHGLEKNWKSSGMKWYDCSYVTTIVCRYTGQYFIGWAISICTRGGGTASPCSEPEWICIFARALVYWTNEYTHTQIYLDT